MVFKTATIAYRDLFALRNLLLQDGCKSSQEFSKFVRIKNNLGGVEKINPQESLWKVKYLPWQNNKHVDDIKSTFMNFGLVKFDNLFDKTVLGLAKYNDLKVHFEKYEMYIQSNPNSITTDELRIMLACNGLGDIKKWPEPKLDEDGYPVD